MITRLYIERRSYQSYVLSGGPTSQPDLLFRVPCGSRAGAKKAQEPKWCQRDDPLTMCQRADHLTMRESFNPLDAASPKVCHCFLERKRNNTRKK